MEASPLELAQGRVEVKRKLKNEEHAHSDRLSFLTFWVQYNYYMINRLPLGYE